MRITVDTNVILRLLLGDDPQQEQIAARELDRADNVILPIVALCETAWVLTSRYGLSRAEVADKLRELTAVSHAVSDRDEVEAGLAMLDLGGDFADGVIARQGRSRRAEAFVSFDRKAVKRLVALGENARLPS